MLDDETPKFKFMISTKRLLATALKFTKLHVDSTYKLDWAGHPVTLVGTSDSNHVFHLIAVGVSTNETTEDFIFFF